MVIDGRGYTQGVTFPSGSSTYVESVSYDLGGNYHTLSGVVGFDKKSLGTNPVFVDITTPMPDSNLTETLYSMTLGPNNLADKFLINVSGVDTLTLQVDYADGGSTRTMRRREPQASALGRSRRISVAVGPLEQAEMLRMHVEPVEPKAGPMPDRDAS
jgi:hypothetical protein